MKFAKQAIAKNALLLCSFHLSATLFMSIITHLLSLLAFHLDRLTSCAQLCLLTDKGCLVYLTLPLIYILLVHNDIMHFSIANDNILWQDQTN